VLLLAGGDKMYCGNCIMRRIIAFFLIAIGVILLICFLPYWMWLAILGAILVCVGIFVLWRKL